MGGTIPVGGGYPRAWFNPSAKPAPGADELRAAEARRLAFVREQEIFQALSVRGALRHTVSDRALGLGLGWTGA